MNRKVFELIRSLSRDAIEAVAPEESSVFASVWGGMVPWLREVWGTRPTAWSLSDAGSSLQTSVGAVGDAEALDLVSTKVVAVVAGALATLARRGESNRVEIEKVVDTLRSQFGLTGSREVTTESVNKDLADVLELGLTRLRNVDIGVSEREFRVMTHEDDFSVGARRLRKLRDELNADNYTVLIDMARDELWIDGMEVEGVPPKSRDALAVLLAGLGELVTYRRLLGKVEQREVMHAVSLEEKNKMHRWFADLRKCHKGLERWVVAVSGQGYRWDGPVSFCVVQPAKRLE